MSLPILNSLDDIRLDRHGVIEASAGTGKTYCIETLVARILREGLAALDQVLLVTFTEKATEELKARIRGRLQGELAEAKGEAATRIHAALENFDRAEVATIHGFCNRVLREQAFENGESFEPRLIDDRDVALSCLRDMQRSLWPQQFGEDLRAALLLAGFPGQVRDHSEWEARILNLAMRYRPQCGDRITPEVDVANGMANLRREIEAATMQLKTAVGKVDAGDVGASEFAVGFMKLNIPEKSLNPRLAGIILPALRFIQFSKEDAVVAASELMKSATNCSGYSEEVGFQFLQGKYKKPGENWREVCPGLQAFIDAMDRMQRALAGGRELLTAVTIQDLKLRMAAWKKEHDALSYNDMIERLAATVGGEGSDDLLRLLRARYRFALVDEFQDTDPRQWSIFSRVFLEGGDGKLFIIGDPKQAIYSFRGADVHTYHAARKEILERHGGQGYSLATNYRSLPPLIHGLNAFFEDGNWFAPDPRTEFVPVSSPEDKHRRTRLYRDNSGRAPLTLIQIPASNALGQRRAVAEAFADEISRLLRPGKPVIEFGIGSDAPRALRADDICVLVRGWKEVPDIEAALRARDIPSSIYKKDGLYQSVEARHLLHLISALAEPGDEVRRRRALLTEFFTLTPEELGARVEADDLPSEFIRLDTWAELAAQRRWPQLTQALLYDSGLAERTLSRADGERGWTNYQHVAQEMELAAFGQALDIAGLAHWLWRKVYGWADATAESDFYRIESEAPKVRIMTIHVSKGLEFPVVMLAGGLSGGMKPDFGEYHDDEGRQVYELIEQPATQALRDQERDSEHRRLYYVACTRAMMKLYLPLTTPRGRDKGPLHTFIRDAALAAEAQLAGSGTCMTIDPNEKKVGGNFPSPSCDAPPQATAKLESRKTLPAVVDLPPRARGLHGRRVNMVSFSQIKSRGHAYEADQDLQFGESALLKDDDEARPLDDIAGESEEFLPPGAETGTALHEIIERVPFETIATAPAPLDLLAEGSASLAAIESGARKIAAAKSELVIDDVARAAAGMVWNALRRPLGESGESWRLADLGPEARRHEMEFHFSFRPTETIPGVTRDPLGFVHGYIDLVFRRDGRYFLADWKSNALDRYDEEAMQACMTEHRYDLQYMLYTVALLRWLRGNVPGFEYEKHFGGVYYFFLRGMRADDASNRKGVYFRRPSESEVAAFESSMPTLAGGGA